MRNFLPFAKRLPDFHYACVVGLKLQKVKSSGGQPYSTIVPRLVGVVSEEQKDWLDYLASEGYSVMVCRGIDDAIRSVKAFKGERDGQAV